MTAKSSGFSLIELLVVVAILGVLASIGIVRYNGYTSITKRKATENAMFQITLAQSEHYNDNGSYMKNDSGKTCTASIASSNKIETDLFSGADIINEDLEHWICVAVDGNDYLIMAINEDNSISCKLELPKGVTIKRTNC